MFPIVLGIEKIRRAIRVQAFKPCGTFTLKSFPDLWFEISMCMYLYWCLSIVIFVINEDFIRKGNILPEVAPNLTLSFGGGGGGGGGDDSRGGGEGSRGGGAGFSGTGSGSSGSGGGDGGGDGGFSGSGGSSTSASTSFSSFSSSSTFSSYSAAFRSATFSIYLARPLASASNCAGVLT